MRAFETIAVSLDFSPDELGQFQHRGGISFNPASERLLKLLLPNYLEKSANDLALIFILLCISKKIIDKGNKKQS